MALVIFEIHFSVLTLKIPVFLVLMSVVVFGFSIFQHILILGKCIW